MFGYVVVNKAEMKFKDFDVYRSYYCGLCRTLREKYGISGQITISNDMTFVLLLLTALYEPKTRRGTTRCAIHPIRKQTVRANSAAEYAADMNVILTCYKCMDDWQDEKKLSRFLYAKLLDGKCGPLKTQYKKKIETIVGLLKELSRLEKKGETGVDRMAGIFGKIMAEIFAWKQDVWEPSLRRMGFFLGKFIYLLDAYEDVEEDAKKGNYNPFSAACKQDGFDEKVQQLLTMMLSECCREFEKLPIIQYGDILRNILYSGVWSRFAAVRKKRGEKQEKEHGRSI